MESDKKLHIICHDIPWPADYGGVVDLFYKLKALHAEGVKIIFHCFKYGYRKEQNELNNYCEEVHYYERRTGMKGLSFSKPYIVQSRANPLLLKRLSEDDHPVLMEGIHCTAFLPELIKQNKKVFLRLHNVESLYYSHLFKYEKNIFRKLYFLGESILLRKYEKSLPKQLAVFSVSQNDVSWFKNELKINNTKFLPVFIPTTEIKGLEGMGNFCMYHGNLAIAENEEAVVWLLKNVFSKIKIPFVIVGRNPSKQLKRLVYRNKYNCIVENPSDKELDDLLIKAHIHVLPSFNATGIKLKLINALYRGRHCVVNEEAIKGTGLEAACHIGVNAAAIASIITQLYHLPFAEEEINLRKKLLPSIFDNQKNARQLIQWIW
jgi:Glycosyl transferases group 1